VSAHKSFLLFYDIKVLNLPKNSTKLAQTFMLVCKLCFCKIITFC